MGLNNNRSFVIYATTLLTHLLFLTLPTALHAQLVYATNDGMVTITGYSGPGGSVTIPPAIEGLPVTAIGESAFSGCSNLTAVTLPGSVTLVDNYAFLGCANLRSVTISEGLVTIGDLAFCGCQIDSLTFPSSLIQIGEWAFSGCIITNLFIPGSVNNIGSRAFSSCDSLVNVTIAEGVVSIGENAFSWCASLANVAIPGTVGSIEAWTFHACPSLTNINIPEGVTNIADNAFCSCTSLERITVPASVSSISTLAFPGCPDLTAFDVSETNAFFSSLDGVLFDKQRGVLLHCPAARRGEYVIPSSVTQIGVGAFSGCRDLTNLVIPGCVINIGDWAFEECHGLLTVGLPSGITCIPNSAFAGCTNLIRLTIPNGVTNIGHFAFHTCYHLKELFFAGNAPTPGINVLGESQNVTIYYLPGSLGWESTFEYRPAVLWNPHIEAVDAKSDRLNLRVVGTTDIPIVLEACTNLVKPSWVALHSCYLTNGVYAFNDSETTNCRTRFYRVRSP